MYIYNYARKYVFILLLALCSLVAAEQQILSLDSALALAKSGNPDLQKQRILLGIEERKNNNGWNVFLPSVNTNLSLRNTHSFPNASVPLEPMNDIGFSAGISLSMNAGVGEAMRQTSLVRDIAELSLLQSEASLLRAVKKQYFTLVTQKMFLVLNDKNLELAKKQEELVQKNYKSGLASELDLLQAQYTSASLQPLLIQKEKEYARAISSLNTMLGLPLDTELQLTDTLDTEFVTVPKFENIDSLIEGRYDIQTSVLNLEKIKSQKLSGNLARLAPSLSLSETMSISKLQNKVALPETGSLSVTVNIPLNGYIPGSRDNLAGKDATDAVTLAQITLEQNRAAARQEIRGYIDTLEQLSSTISMTRLSEKIAERACQLTEDGYKAGLINQADLDAARQKLLNAQLSVVSAGNSYKAGLIDLAYALNIPESGLFEIRGEK